MRYEKPFREFDELADLVISRGMECDRDVLIEHLKDAGYYRLSGYWHIFKADDDTFAVGTTFGQVWDIYRFDRQFRLLVLDAIERVEIYFRTQLAHELARESGAFGYLDHANLPRLKDKQYVDFIHKCEGYIGRSREPFVLHFNEKYGDEHKLPPYWMMVNAMDFGMMFTLYRGAPVAIRGKISSDVGLSARVLDSWLMTFNTVRNICAHHGRLWNRTLGTKPKIPKEEKDPRWHEPFEVEPDKMFCVLTMLRCLLIQIAPETRWHERLLSLMDGHPDIDRKRMGFADGWQSCPFWDFQDECADGEDAH